jgi:hypothetical protein
LFGDFSSIGKPAARSHRLVIDVEGDALVLSEFAFSIGELVWDARNKPLAWARITPVEYRSGTM